MEIIFITIDVPGSSHIVTLQNKVAIRFDSEKETYAQVAKQLRKSEARMQGCKPSLLSWAVFVDVEDDVPVANSANW